MYVARSRSRSRVTKKLKRSAPAYPSSYNDYNVEDRLHESRVSRGLVPSSVVYDFINTVNFGTLSTSGTATIPNGYAFTASLSSFNQSATFAALFDQWRIRKFEVMFLPRTNSFSAVESFAVPTMPSVFVANDFDDDSSPSTVASMLDYQDCKIFDASKKFTHIMVPKALNVQYQPALSAYGNSPSKQWMDSAYPGIKYYGVKILVGALPINVAVSVCDVFVKVFLQFKSSR